jgi:hypothetical protein
MRRHAVRRTMARRGLGDEQLAGALVLTLQENGLAAAREMAVQQENAESIAGAVLVQDGEGAVEDARVVRERAEAPPRGPDSARSGSPNTFRS